MKVKKVFDLTATVRAFMPVWPTAPLPELKPAGILSRDGFNIETLHSTTHAGTHIDAPFHFIDGGKTIDRIDPLKFIFDAYCIDAGDAGTEIGSDYLVSRWRKEYDGSGILLRTGWDGKRGFTKEFLYDFPGLSVPGAEFLAEHHVHAVGIDTLGIEPYSHSDFAVHRILLRRETIIMEDLANLDALEEGRKYTVAALPLKLLDSSGSMARVVAIDGD
jgi:kynurenine formamidase